MTEQLEFPYSFEELSEEHKKLTEKCFGIDVVRVVPTKYVYPRRIKKYGVEFYNFKPRPDDIWLMGYPRSGTTMTQEILYLLGTGLNYEKAASTIMDVRFPFLQLATVRSEEDEKEYEELSKNSKLTNTTVEELVKPAHVKLAETKEKRFIKHHSGLDFTHPTLLEVGCKVVFIARNVKDCIVSNFYYPAKQEDKSTDINEYWLLYKHDLTYVANYFEMLKDGWKNRHNKNLLFLFYEEVNNDKRAAILKIAKFLGVKLTEEELNKLVDHVDIKNFKKNKSVNNDHLVDLGLYMKNEKYSFIRKGKSGGWRDLFSPELNKEVDEWIRKRLKEIPDFEMPECWKKAMDME